MKFPKTLFKKNCLLFFLLAGGLIFTAFPPLLFAESAKNPQDNKKPFIYTYKVVNIYPHDQNAFTQGLVYEKGFFFEGTGINGKSFLYKKEYESGKILQFKKLPAKYFGEGIAFFNDKIIQLTWKDHIAFIYDKNSFKFIKKVNYQTEGWGITFDGKSLIMSDGSSFLYFYDPDTFMLKGKIEVLDKSQPVININELEYIKGDIWANVWGSEQIAIIDKVTGNVKGWINLDGILDHKNYDGADVLNGIAYDLEKDRIFVTGKLWPFLFEIEIFQIN